MSRKFAFIARRNKLMAKTDHRMFLLLDSLYLSLCKELAFDGTRELLVGVLSVVYLGATGPPCGRPDHSHLFPSFSKNFLSLTSSGSWMDLAWFNLSPYPRTTHSVTLVAITKWTSPEQKN